MPLSSMTGFGQAEVSTPSGNYRVEIRSVNNRFLDIQMHVPRTLANLESRIKKLLCAKIARGSVTIIINWSHDDDKGKLVWDKVAVGNYMAIFREIQKEYNLKEEVSLSNLLTFSDFTKKETVEYSDILIWKHLRPVIETALKDLINSRQKEASFILSDLKKMVKVLSKTLDQIERRAPIRLKSYTEDLRKKIEQLAGRIIEPSRLAVEIALMADKQDIAEECTRFRAHIERMNADFNSNEPVGKRLGFILQEMNREANTIGAKATDTKISHWSVVLKENVEKIREQILNIE